MLPQSSCRTSAPPTSAPPAGVTLTLWAIAGLTLTYGYDRIKTRRTDRRNTFHDNPTATTPTTSTRKVPETVPSH
ncbi:hypothetical protein [Streptomyces lydicamycinicus]|uniref:hypothetical protein n=1 Tax=Streptomyces lydicamycinicus TaxID=1546107 RepID=UPI003C2BA751